MTIIGFIRKRIIAYGRIKSYLAVVSFISAAVGTALAVWYVFGFIGHIRAFKDIHNGVVDLLRTCGYVLRALSTTVLFVFIVRDYKKRSSVKFEVSLLFLLAESILTFASFVFDRVWNSVEYIDRPDMSTDVTPRVLVLAGFLLSLFGLFRQSKKQLSSPVKRILLLILFIASEAAYVYLERIRLYGVKDKLGLILAELAAMIVYSPYIICIATGIKPKKYRGGRRGERNAAETERPRAVREPRLSGNGYGGELDDIEKELARLEKAYKNGEISKRKYERRKNELFDDL